MSNGTRTCGSRIGGNAAWSLALLTTVIGGDAAFGAPVGQPETAASPYVLQEVVVTAEKRTSTVQKTPISITAITGAALQAQGITSLEDAVQQVPGLSMTTAGPGQTEYVLRGISNATAGVEVGKQGTTGFYLDDTPIAPPSFATSGLSEIDPDLFDLKRIEVLRGPQGTLYGDGSEGGTIKLVTNEPELTQFAGEVEGTGSGTQHGGLNGSANVMLNMPIIDDKVAVRIVGTDKHNSGWIDRVVVPSFPLETGPSNGFFGTVRGDLSNPVGAQVHKGVNDTDLRGGRVEVLIKPTEQLTIEPTVFYQKLTQGGFDAYDSHPGALAHYQPFDIAEPFEEVFKLYSLRMVYDFPAFSLTSATAYEDQTSTITEDGSEQVQNDLSLPAFDTALGGAGPISSTETNPSTQFSQELRLASTAAGPLQWIVGGFYSNSRGHFTDGIVNPVFVPLFGTANLYTFLLRNGRQESAVFGNVNYAVTDKLKATVGLRYDHTKTTTGVTESGLNSVTASDAVFSIDEPQTASVVNPMANISYSPSDDLMLYGTAARGFRAGAGEIPVPTTGLNTKCVAPLQALGLSASPTRISPEHVWSYEAGEKARLLDRTVTLNGDVFYENLADVQTGFILPGCGFAVALNAAKARSYGSEIELEARLGSHVDVSQAVDYTNAAYTANSPGVYAGESLVNAPKYSLSSSIQYTTPVSDAMRLVARLSNSYTASHYDNAYTRRELPGYDLLKGRVGLITPTWSAYLFVDNLTNRRAELTTRNDLIVNLPTFDRIITNQPRTIGIDLDYSF